MVRSQNQRTLEERNQNFKLGGDQNKDVKQI